MMTFTAQDVVYMQMALELAEKGQFTTTPNPSVGCVLVKDGIIVGRGFHVKAGRRMLKLWHCERREKMHEVQPLM